VELTVSADTPTPATATPIASPAMFGRTAMAIFATMVLLIVALTGILVETTWRNPSAAPAEYAPTDPGSVAQR
jgi:hypothetical protein